jgi:cardiolipin synthase A/B
VTPSGHACCEALAAITSAPIVEGNALRLLRDGDVFFPEFLAAVRSAQSTIAVQIFRFHGGRIASEFAAAFAERARSGVQVRVLIDAYGTGAMDRSIQSVLTAAGVELRVYHPIHLRALHRAYQRSHRKIIVVDGRDAFLGGMNLDDAFAGGPNARRWRENAVHARGPLASAVDASIDEAWAALSGARRSLVARSSAPLGPSHAQLFLSEHGGSTMRDVFLHSIASAQRAVHITSAYLIPEPDVSAALAAAARRGVEVQLLTTGAHNNIAVARLASRATYARLLGAGVRIFEYRPTMLHAKSIVVDGSWCSLGSANVDACSLRRNLEANIGTCDAAFVAEVERSFAVDVEESDEVMPASWRTRPFLQRAAEAATIPLRSLL